jgi:hypothetical protein
MPDTTPLTRTVQSRVPSARRDRRPRLAGRRGPVRGDRDGGVVHPDAAITGANTNTRTISLVNKGQDGTGTTVVATLALTSGVNRARLRALAGSPEAAAALRAAWQPIVLARLEGGVDRPRPSNF